MSRTGRNVALEHFQTFSKYLEKIGTQIAERIQNQFIPRFDPEKEQISTEIQKVDENIFKNA